MIGAIVRSDVRSPHFAPTPVSCVSVCETVFETNKKKINSNKAKDIDK
jgi:hypothetical protein